MDTRPHTELGPTYAAATGQRPGERAPRPHPYPPATWPSKEQLTYTKEAVTVLLLLLALPWLVVKLITHPSDVLAGIGRRQVAKAT